MGRGRDEETRRIRTRRHDEGGYYRQGYGGRHEEDRYHGPYYDRNGNRYYEDYEGNRLYDEDRDSRYHRDRDSEREYYWRERESRQETRRTAYMVIGGICVALIALLGVLALTGDDSSETAGQDPAAPQQAQPVPQQQAPEPVQQPQAPAAPQGVPQDAASSEQVEGLRASMERQLAEIRQSINQLRLEIWSFFGSNQQKQESAQ